MTIKYNTLSAFGAVALITLLWLTCSNCRTIKNQTDSMPITHELWDAFLKKHIGETGFVDYAAVKEDMPALEKYLKRLESAHPNDKNWSRNQQMAYWINAYNAFTIKIVADNYPVASIKDIKNGIPFVNTVWDIKFIEIQGFKYDLNNIEHNILRPIYEDARIHAAVNCASFSCPKLQRDAFTADKLDAQLDAAMKSFINDPIRNKISTEEAKVSEIFKWFKGDFKENQPSVKAFINQYADTKINEATGLNYIDYDWRLNGIENAPK